MGVSNGSLQTAVFSASTFYHTKTPCNQPAAAEAAARPGSNLPAAAAAAPAEGKARSVFAEFLEFRVETKIGLFSKDQEDVSCD
jgi:hypothetical protein